jgi:glycoside/pentoside/hexuronide:cation symporter, GPH family
MTVQIQSLPFWKKIMYALGQYGWSLASYGVLNLITQFYVTTTDKTPEYVIFLPGVVFIGITVLGLIEGSGRVFDAITDPLIAGWSDRSKSKLGRRRKFLLISVVPFSVLSFLVFFPPVAQPSAWNVVFLVIVLFLFYFSMTMYVTPFFALMSELGHSPKERLEMSTLISITWALGFATGSQALGFKSIFRDILIDSMGFEAVQSTNVLSFQLVMIVFGVLSLILMLLPIIFINEKKYCEPHVSKEGSFEAVKNAFKNKNFRFFTLSDLTYWLSLTFIQTGMQPFYVTKLLGLEESTASIFMLIMFACSFAFYVPVNFIARRFGKKKILVIGFITFSISFSFVAIMGRVPFIDPFVQGVIAMVWSAIPISIFGILPNAIVADIAEYEGIRTGNYKAGIFFGARTFMQKIGQSIAKLIFPSFLLIGAITALTAPDLEAEIRKALGKEEGKLTTEDIQTIKDLYVNPEGQFIQIEDEGLEREIREAIDKPTGNLTISDLERLEDVYIEDRGEIVLFQDEDLENQIKQTLGIGEEEPLTKQDIDTLINTLKVDATGAVNIDRTELERAIREALNIVDGDITEEQIESLKDRHITMIGEVGLRLTGIAALIFLVLGLLLFLKYDEKEVLRVLNKKEDVEMGEEEE